jgi:hypothetical protein
LNDVQGSAINPHRPLAKPLNALDSAFGFAVVKMPQANRPTSVPAQNTTLPVGRDWMLPAPSFVDRCKPDATINSLRRRPFTQKSGSTEITAISQDRQPASKCGVPPVNHETSLLKQKLKIKIN